MKEIIKRELEAWRYELKIYDALRRGSNSIENQTKYYIMSYCTSAIIRELEELTEMIEDEKKAFKCKNQVLKLYKTVRKDSNGELFDAFSTVLYLPVKGEENLGPQLKYLNVYFNDGLDTSKFENEGTLLVAKDKMKRPYIYELRENGKKPYVYIYEYIDYVGEGSENNV